MVSASQTDDTIAWYENLRVDDRRIDDRRIDDPRVDDPRVDDPRVDDPRVDDPRVDDPRVDDPRIDDGASVELIQLTAERESEAVVLNWQMAAEQNNAGFEIQRRQAVGSGPEPTWERIGYVEGAGTTDEPQNDPQRYRFRDSAPPTGALAYRLKQIDTDGVEAFSDPVVIP